jgi:hypothetical protein
MVCHCAFINHVANISIPMFSWSGCVRVKGQLTEINTEGWVSSYSCPCPSQKETIKTHKSFGTSVQAVYANLLFAFFQPEKLNSAQLPIQKGAQ